MDAQARDGPPRAHNADSEVDIEITVNGIHSFHLLEVRASSLSSFSLEVHESRIYYSEYGVQQSESLVSSLKKDLFEVVVVSIIGVYAQLPTVLDAQLRYGKGPGVARAEYGVRFYPYISSILRFNFNVRDGHVRALKVNNGPEIRLLWSQASFKDETGQELPRQVAHSSIGWQESLAWLPASKRPQSLLIQLPVRASSRTISTSILHPMFTWLATMVGITLAWQLATPAVVVASVIGSWSFLLREWAASARAHQINLLTAIFIFQGAAAAAWGFTLHQGKIAASILGFILVIFTMDLFFASVRFDYRGYLPKRIAVPWAWIAINLERLRARRRKKLNLTDFDYERTAAPLKDTKVRSSRLAARLMGRKNR